MDTGRQPKGALAERLFLPAPVVYLSGNRPPKQGSTAMGTIVVSENVTIDGVIEDPTGDDGSSVGGWFSRITDGDREAWAKVEFEEAVTAAAMLLGRRTYEWLAARWMTREGDWAERLNNLPKYIASATLEAPEWTNSFVLKGDVVTEAAALKQRIAGEIVVNGSGRLARTLIEHDLVDELRLMVYPFVVGPGERMFGAVRGQQPFRLVDAQTVGTDLALLTYRSRRG
jgi:dihydrofolate reductase